MKNTETEKEGEKKNPVVNGFYKVYAVLLRNRKRATTNRTEKEREK